VKTVAPRAVVITRPTEYQALLLRHGTKEQARFFLDSRGQSLDQAFARHALQERALHQTLAALPRHWRRAHVGRADLDRFLFEPEDFIIAVGQDGLVANVAKYLSGQSVVGINPAPDAISGVLVRHRAEAVFDLTAAFEEGTLEHEERAMVRATADDGRSLLALNEVFVGHRSHQSARYCLRVGGHHERQSSSGLIVATGTGATGWARSIALHRGGCPALPGPTSSQLVFLVREAWPSRTSGTDVVHGTLEPDATLTVVCEMEDGGVCFGDGIESDRLELAWGQVLSVGRASCSLRLAV
jgi:NAD kinase